MEEFCWGFFQALVSPYQLAHHLSLSLPHLFTSHPSLSLSPSHSSSPFLSDDQEKTLPRLQCHIYHTETTGMYIHTPMHTRSGDTTSYHTDQEPMRAEGTDTHTHTHRDRATKNLCLCSSSPCLYFTSSADPLVFMLRQGDTKVPCNVILELSIYTYTYNDVHVEYMLCNCIELTGERCIMIRGGISGLGI